MHRVGPIGIGDNGVEMEKEQPCLGVVRLRSL